MNELRIGQMLSDQLQQQDPFTQAKQMAMQQPQSGNDVLGGDQMFNQPQMQSITPQMPQQAQGPMQNQGPAMNPASQLFSPASPQDANKWQNSPVPKLLQKMGIDSNNIAMNDLGKLQLIARLRNKFGADYKNNPEAMDVMAQFDKHLGSQKDNQPDMNAMLANGQRTLGALLRGS
jgi:hypothetical protein